MCVKPFVYKFPIKICLSELKFLSLNASNPKGEQEAAGGGPEASIEKFYLTASMILHGRMNSFVFSYCLAKASYILFALAYKSWPSQGLAKVLVKSGLSIGQV